MKSEKGDIAGRYIHRCQVAGSKGGEEEVGVRIWMIL
jgi:hypothetical protein